MGKVTIVQSSGKYIVERAMILNQKDHMVIFLNPALTHSRYVTLATLISLFLHMQK